MRLQSFLLRARAESAAGCGVSDALRRERRSVYVTKIEFEGGQNRLDVAAAAVANVNRNCKIMQMSTIWRTNTPRAHPVMEDRGVQFQEAKAIEIKLYPTVSNGRNAAFYSYVRISYSEIVHTYTTRTQPPLKSFASLSTLSNSVLQPETWTCI